MLIQRMQDRAVYDGSRKHQAPYILTYAMGFRQYLLTNPFDILSKMPGEQGMPVCQVVHHLLNSEATAA